MDGGRVRTVLRRMQSWRYFSVTLYGTLLLLAVFFYGVGDGWFAAAPRDGPGQMETSLETRLEDILSTVRGAGRVRVLITYATAGAKA